MSSQGTRGLEAAKATGLEVVGSYASGVAQRFEARFLFRFEALDEPKTLSQHFAGVLIAARLHQTLYEGCLVLSENYVAGRHETFGRKCAALADYAILTCATYKILQRAAETDSARERPINKRRILVPPAALAPDGGSVTSVDWPRHCVV